jgi:hypothetical protein
MSSFVEALPGVGSSGGMQWCLPRAAVRPTVERLTGWLGEHPIALLPERPADLTLLVLGLAVPAPPLLINSCFAD